MLKHLKLVLLFAAVMASITLSPAPPAFADGEQKDVQPGTNPMTLLNGGTLQDLLDATPAIESAPAFTIKGNSTVWGVTFGNGMTEGQVAHGLDLSVWDGGSNDFAKARADGLEFAIIRCGYGSDLANQDDTYWIRNVKQARDNGIPFGVYIYSYATNTEMAKSEAWHVLRQLNNANAQLGITPRDITYPIYFDYEDPSQSGLDRWETQSIVNAFAQTIKADPQWGVCEVGYYSMRIWCEDDNKLNQLKTFSYNGKTYRYSRWVAEWGTNTWGSVHVLHNNAGEVIAPTWYDIWQVCSNGKAVAGIRNGQSPLDVDFAYKNFPADITGCMGRIWTDTSLRTYTGGAQSPSVSVQYGMTNPKNLVNGVDYTVSYENNVATGTGKVKITGIGKYKGYAERLFRIERCPIANAAISPIPNQVKLGTECRPQVTLVFGDSTLVQGRDYKVAYSNNTKAGTAKVTITGIGNFTGTTAVAFTIVEPGSGNYEEVAAMYSDAGIMCDHVDEIAWVTRNSIAEGWQTSGGKKEFRPYADVARADMAAFLYRLAVKWEVVDDETWTPSTAQKKAFSDVNSSTPHAREIWWLASAGISEGWTNGGSSTFRPLAPVARQDVAAFMFRLAKLAGKAGVSDGWTPSAASKNRFSDVSPNDAANHGSAVCWLAETGISEGFAAGGKYSFAGLSPVKRCDMAAFLARLDSIANGA